jgi:hypothetical protein
MLKEMFTFLDDLREGGSINMFGAPKVLQEAFGLSKAESFEVFTAWTKQFTEE